MSNIDRGLFESHVDPHGTMARRIPKTDGGKSRGDIQAAWSIKRGDWGKNGAL